jgi:formate/nitrite transporter FocA (FNT family)
MAAESRSTGAPPPTEAGEASPHLNESEQKQAAESSPLGPLVIHEVVRKQGEEELKRSFSGLAWSGVAAGLSIGFSFLLESALLAGLPEAPWTRLVAGFGYSLGFLIVILGQQQLFTETTLTALIPSLTERTWPKAIRTLRVWAIVLGANLFGTIILGAILANMDVFPPPMLAAMKTLSAETTALPFWPTLAAAGFAGWLIGLMVWLLPGAGPARPLIIVLLTYAVAACHFQHIVAGSAEAAFSVFSGNASVGDYLLRFVVPTLLGNIGGGTALAALFNHAPVADRLLTQQHNW